MSHVLFLYNTIFDAATLTLTQGSEDSGWPLENIQDTIRRKAAKLGGSGTVIIDIDFAQVLTASAIALVEHDLNAEATVTVRAFADEERTSQIIEHSFEAIGPLLALVETAWLTGGWLGYPTAADLERYPRIVSLEQFDATAALYWQIEIDNGGDDFYLGRILLDKAWQPARNYDIGHKYGLVDPSNIDESLGQVLWTDTKEPYYQLSFTLSYLTEAEIYNEYLRLAYWVGRHKDFVVRLDDGSNKKAKLTTIYGRFTNNPTVQGKSLDRGKADFSIRESI